MSFNEGMHLDRHCGSLTDLAAAADFGAASECDRSVRRTAGGLGHTALNAHTHRCASAGYTTCMHTMATMSLKRWRNGNLKSESRDEPIMALASNLAEELGVSERPPRGPQALTTTSEAPVRPGSLKQTGLIGDGTYGTVYAASFAAATGPSGPTAGHTVACKLLEGGTSMYAFQDAAREAFGLGCAGLLQAVAYGDAAGAAAGASNGPATGCPKVGLFMPMLGSRIGNSLVPKFPLPVLAALMKPIAESLAAMTGMHRDVKPANILVPVTRGATAQIIDFSLATAQKVSSDFNVVTLWYRAPEILLKQPYTNKVDVWAFGIVLFNLITGCHITRASSEDHLDSLLLDLVTYFGLPKTPWAPLFAKLDAIGGGRARFPTSGIMHLGSIVAEATGLPVKTPMVRYATELLEACLRVSPLERADWSKVLALPFWRIGSKASGGRSTNGAGGGSGGASGTPYGPCAIKQDPAYDGDLDAFLSGAMVVPVQQSVSATGSTGPTTESVTKGRINIVDHFLHYGAKLGFTQKTAVVAYWLWRYAGGSAGGGSAGGPAGPTTIERLSACLFLAAAYNEDCRVRAHGWRAWAAAWDEPDKSEAFRAAVMPVLAAVGGRWPAADLDALWTSAVGPSVGPIEAWQVPFVVALAQLPEPTRPGVPTLVTVPADASAAVVAATVETVRNDATSILSRTS